MESQYKGSKTPFLQESGGRRRKDEASSQADISALSFLLCSDTVGWKQEEHPAHKNLRHLFPIMLSFGRNSAE